MGNGLNGILSGAMTMAYSVAGLLFLRFWKRTHDALFIYFAAAFWILAIQRLALGIVQERYENDIVFYLLRLLAFLLILAGIWQKNRSGQDRP